MKPTVVFIEDEVEKFEAFSKLLTLKFKMTRYQNMAAFLHDVDSLEFDTIFINQKSQDIVKVIRSHSKKSLIPVFMVDMEGDEEKKVSFLESGITDFIHPEMNPSELIARVESRIVDFKNNSEILSEANLSIDRRIFDCRINGERINLTMIEYKILVLILKNNPRKIIKEEIVNCVWKDELVNTKNLNTHIFNLRKKIADWSYEILFDRREGFYLRPKKDW